ncbi:hypothetical protein LXA43DRAFT_1065951 [Ganoderma leucocontextum]|nr:hypothetical protein LXA43DRAFT_1065951 [Ganoderma leucocontextum]
MPVKNNTKSSKLSFFSKQDAAVLQEQSAKVFESYAHKTDGPNLCKPLITASTEMQRRAPLSLTVPVSTTALDKKPKRLGTKAVDVEKKKKKIHISGAIDWCDHIEKKYGIEYALVKRARTDDDKMSSMLSETLEGPENSDYGHASDLTLFDAELPGGKEKDDRGWDVCDDEEEEGWASMMGLETYQDTSTMELDGIDEGKQTLRTKVLLSIRHALGIWSSSS